jgi:hypothetical protein
MEEIHYLLSKAYKEKNHRSAADVLIDLDNKMISTQSPVDNIALKIARKISVKFGYWLYGTIPSLYLKWLKLIDKSDTELLINLCNDALSVKDSLIGTEVGDSIYNHVRDALIYLVQQGSLDSQQSQLVQQLLEQKSNINFEEELEYSIEEIESDSPIGMHILIDLFSTLGSSKDQFYYYSTQISSLIKSLQSKRPIEIYHLTIKFIDIFLLPTKYLIKVNENNVEYQLSHLKLFNSYEDVFYTSTSLIKILLQSDSYINENSIKLIYKLWNLYPHLRKHLYDLIVTNFKTISASNSVEPKKKAAEFLYVIVHDKEVDGDFKVRLESEGLDSLFEDENYNVSQLMPIDLQNLKINSGYPICVEIKPGETYCYFVEIEHENSILTWGFASEEYDISYKIYKIEATEKVIYSEDRCNCDISPIIGLEFATSPGLYKFEWINNFSWFRSKKVRFRISVLVPVAEKYPKDQVQVINILNPDDKLDLCYNTSDTVFSEIGVYIKSDSITFYSLEYDTFPLKNPNEIPDIISRYSNMVQNKIRKIGILEKSAVIRDYDLECGCIAVCRDVDAFTLMNHDRIQGHTLIGVIEDEGLRSAVFIGGKLFSSGNVANLKNQEPAVAIATLLSLFGPATVVVHGLDLEKLVSRARLLVPVGIWNQSSIFLSDFTLAQCAARLHYLLYRYKSSL